MAIVSLTSMGVSIGAFMGLQAILDWLSGDPEAGLQEGVARNAALAKSALLEPAEKAQAYSDIEGRYRIPAREIVGQAAAVKSGAIPVAGAQGMELLAQTAARMNMTPEQLAQRLNPARKGDFSNLSRAAFGRGPRRADRG